MKVQGAIDDMDKQIIRALQGNFPIVSQPYKQIAEEIGIDEETLLRRLNSMKETGVLRKMGAVLRHLDVGYRANALGVWVVAPEHMDEVAEKMCDHPEVTHCYDRNTTPDWPYNFYTMLHGQTEKDCIELARQLSEETGIKDYQLQFTEKEWKKTSMKYFMDE